MNSVGEIRTFVYYYRNDNMKLEIVRLGMFSVVGSYHLTFTQSLFQKRV
jgi:hypothetical protein